MVVSFRRPRWNRLTKFVALLLVVTLADAAAAGLVYAAHRNDPPIPYFVSTETSPRPGVDAYTPMSPAYHFDTAVVPPRTVDSRGRIRLIVDGHAVLDPDTSVEYALAALAEHDQTGDQEWLLKAETAMLEVLDTTRRGLVLHARPMSDDTGLHLARGWVSARTQGLVLSAATRLWTTTGQQPWRHVAVEVFDSLMRFKGFEGKMERAPRPWLSLLDASDHVWFEQYPQGREPSRTMTGHIFALFGVYDFIGMARGARLEAAGQLFEAGVSTVSEYVPEIRLLNAAAFTSPNRVDRSWTLHQVLVRQLVTLARMTGESSFRQLSRALAKDIAVRRFRTTGILPVADLDAYAGADGVRLLPPTGPDSSDGAGTERATRTQNLKPDVVLTGAIRSLSRYEATGDRRWLRHARNAVSRVLKTSRDGLVPHQYAATNVAGQKLVEPWFSAQTQGLLLSAIVRLEEATKEARWPQAADAVFSTLLLARNNFGTSAAEPPPVWLSYVGDETYPENLWFDKYWRQDGDEHYNRPSTVVDAHLAAVIGVYDHWRTTHDPRAVRLFDGGVSTLISRLPDIRVEGNVSQSAVIWGVFRLDHHRVMTRQVALLARITGNETLARYARDLARDAS